ncbi:hypothetical protein CLOM_g5665 [Closterium sp. NIES-68]|nr:hypothetical protein CLOM_g5665 [Closterium sp. NIES-68]
MANSRLVFSPPVAIAALAVLAALLLVAPRSAADGAANSDVLVLTPESFHDHVGGDSVVFVKFFTPWCGHCQRLAPEWEKVATAFKDSDAIRIAEVDCQAHSALCGNHEVHGYPAIKWFGAGQTTSEDYAGGRKAEAFVDFINGRIGTRAKVESDEPESRVRVMTAWAFPSVMLDATKHVLVYFYDGACKPCKEMTKTVEKLAAVFKGHDDILFAKVDGDNEHMLASRFKIETFPYFKFFTKENKYGEDLKGDPLPSLSDLVSFVNKHTGARESSSGVPLDKVGRIPELDAIAESFLEASEAERQEMMVRAMGLVVAPELEGHGVFYQKAMKSIVDEGEEWVSKEHARLTKLLAGSLKPDKVEKFSARRNILEAFHKA